MNGIISSIINWTIGISFLILFMTYLYFQNILIEIEHIDIKLKDMPEHFNGLKIAHISDVHIPNNAFNLEKLINILKREKPDIIAISGDLIYKYKKIDEVQLGTFCNSLSNIARTYAVTGNHEIWSESVEQWNEILKANNVIIVDNKIEIFENNKSAVAIIGLEEGCLYSEENYSYKDFELSIPKILLAHRPERFDKYCSSSIDIRPDLVLSGHAHGGQFRIPLLNKAIYAPDQGFFPKFSSGLYTSYNGIQMVISRGLSNSIFPVRIHNKVHLPIIHLKS